MHKTIKYSGLKADTEQYEYTKSIFLHWAIIFLLFFLSANCIVDESLKPVFSPFNAIKEEKDHKLLRKYSAVFPSELSACLLTRLEISAYMLKLIFKFHYSVESFHFRRHQHSVDNSMVLIELNASWHWRVNESVDYCNGKFHSKIFFH